MSLSDQFLNMNINPGRRRPPLSVNNPSDPRATPARKLPERNTNNEQARFLVKAFEDFILPIVHTQGSGLGVANRKTNANGEYIGRDAERVLQGFTDMYLLADNTDRTRLGRAAQQLVDALENFVTSLVNEPQSEQVSDIPENMGLVPSVRTAIGRPQSRSLILRSKAPERPRILTLALEAARYRVFNKMPIRLLTFKFDGSGIKLLDRNDTWDYVSTSIEAGFNEDQISEDIKRRNYPVHNPDAEKEAIAHYISPYTRYAILSHTWLRDKPGEVTYGHWNSGNIDTDSPGYQKLSTFCKVAATEYGITLAWIDTICINKDSSAELDESIRSMYNWYRDASICITYLAQTTTLADMDKDAWFTRGWTLQELLAPRYIKFYGATWKKLTSDLQNDKENSSVQMQILAATTITSVELNNTKAASISRKMQWAANRYVTREEDTAYSLMGIFNISLSIAYGEGAERAFFRLVQEILNSKEAVLDVINWGYGSDFTRAIDDTCLSSLIPSRPQQYLSRAENLPWWPFPSIPVTLTHLGLHVSVLLMPAISVDDLDLNPFYSIGDYYSSVTLDAAFVDPSTQKIFLSNQRYNILDKATQQTTYKTAIYPHQVTFGVLNFATTGSLVSLRTTDGLRITCFAVALYFNISDYPSRADAAADRAVQVLRTRTAVSFDLKSHRFKNPLPSWVSIPKNDLARHGMQLLDMYL